MARPLKDDVLGAFVGADVASQRGGLAWPGGGRLGSTQGEGWNVFGGLGFCFFI